MEKSIFLEKFCTFAKEHPQNPAVWADKETLSYASLFHFSKNLAGLLKASPLISSLLRFFKISSLPVLRKGLAKICPEQPYFQYLRPNGIYRRLQFLRSPPFF